LLKQRFYGIVFGGVLQVFGRVLQVFVRVLRAQGERDKALVKEDVS
jgi:hypothetical protein